MSSLVGVRACGLMFLFYMARGWEGVSGVADSLGKSLIRVGRFV